MRVRRGCYHNHMGAWAFFFFFFFGGAYSRIHQVVGGAFIAVRRSSISGRRRPTRYVTTTTTGIPKGPGSAGLPRKNPPRRSRRVDDDDDTDQDTSSPDLFDYFDPLLSPHAYSQGISPQAGLPSSSSQSPAQSRPYMGADEEKLPAEEEEDDDDDDDPLRLRVGGGWKKPSKRMKMNRLEEEDDDRVSAVGRSTASLRTSEEPPRPAVDPLKVFDPTLSPHVYTRGQVPSVVVGDELSESTRPPQEEAVTGRRRLGILLVDHGSRSEASNQRLHDLARLYQQQLWWEEKDFASSSSSSFDHGLQVTVQAAHMELASPNIAQGLQLLLEQGVEEIICHPYFLSPGRHVQQDIPRLIQEAVEQGEIQIPVRTTPPLGSQTDRMIQTIHALVQESSPLLSQSRAPNTQNRQRGDKGQF